MEAWHIISTIYMLVYIIILTNVFCIPRFFFSPQSSTLSLHFMQQPLFFSGKGGHSRRAGAKTWILFSFWLTRRIFVSSFSFDIMSDLQKSHRNTPEDSPLPFIHSDRNTYCRSLIIIFLSPLNYLRGSCRHETPFISKYFSVYFLRTWTFSLKEGGIFFHNPGVIIWIREWTWMRYVI